MRPIPAALAAALLLTTAVLAEEGDGTQVLTGIYTSGYQDRPAGLRAVFTPSSEDEWTVVFHFTHAGRRHEYRGTATGNLSTGDLSGRVRNEGGNRTFTFRCVFDGGRCKGTHAEVGRLSRRERRTGTLTLQH